MPQRLQYDFTFSNSQKDPSADQRNKGAMRILLMGDFSGHSNRGLDESGDKLARRSIAAVDFDNFNDTMISYRNRNAVRLMRFQSIAEPLKMLSGPWV